MTARLGVNSMIPEGIQLKPPPERIKTMAELYGPVEPSGCPRNIRTVFTRFGKPPIERTDYGVQCFQGLPEDCEEQWTSCVSRSTYDADSGALLEQTWLRHHSQQTR